MNRQIERIIFLSFLFMTQTVFSQTQMETGIKLYEDGKFEKAEIIFQKILDQNEENAEANFYMGLINFIYKKDNDSAEEYLEEAVDLAPDNADYHYWLGNVYGILARDANIFSQLSLATSCKDEFEKAVKLNPKHVKARVGLIQYLIQAPGIVGGSMEEARTHIKILKELSPYNYYTMEATTALTEERYSDAITMMQKAIETDPTQVEAYNTLGYLYIRYSTDTQKAIDTFLQMVKLKPNDANSYDSLGDGYFNSKMYDEAMASYKKALKINPEFIPSIFNVARVYDVLNNKTEALNWYKKYLSKVDAGRQSDIARDRIDELE